MRKRTAVVRRHVRTSGLTRDRKDDAKKKEDVSHGKPSTTPRFRVVLPVWARRYMKVPQYFLSGTRMIRVADIARTRCARS
jgi:hypothetical protein